MPEIEIRKLSKTYGEGAAAVPALTGIALDVHAGEVLILAGPSGSGKTTLLSIMGAILRPTTGSVKIRGIDIAGLSERRLPRVRLENIGFIFQGFNLFPSLSVLENVELALSLHGISGRQARVRAEALLARMGLEDKLDAQPSDLSGGQKQRVAIARALAGDPPIVLADEPTASLDSASGLVVIDLLTSLARKDKRAVVIVTHDPRVFEHGSRIIHIADGRITQPEKELLPA